MALIEVSTHIQGSAETSVKPLRVMSVSASLKGQSAAGPRRPRPSSPPDFSKV